MRIILGIVAACLLGVFLTGCMFTAPVIPPTALVFTNIKAPIDVDAASTPVALRKGEASSISVLGLVAVGDASVHAAAEEGDLTKVEHIDYKFLNVLGLFTRFTTIVYGE